MAVQQAELATRARRKFTVDDVERMLEARILSEDDPVELIDGELVLVSAQGKTHAMLVSKLQRRLDRAYDPKACVRSHSPIDADAHSQPEPDLAVVRGEPEDYDDHHPRGDEALLLIEVAVTTLADARSKTRVYAQAGAPVLWIVDVADRHLEVHTDPREGEYAVVTRLAEDREVELPGLGVRWRVADLLP